MLSATQHDRIKRLIASSINEAITEIVAVTNGKSSKNTAWNALEDFHRLCEEAGIYLPDVNEWAGYESWPNTFQWKEKAQHFFSRKNKVYLFYVRKGKQMPDIQANYYRLFKDDYGFACIGSNNQTLLGRINFQDCQHLLDEKKIVEI